MKLVTFVLIMIASFSLFEVKAQSITYSNVLEIVYTEKGEVTEKVAPNGLKVFKLGNCIWLQRFDEKIILLFSVMKSENKEKLIVYDGLLNASGEEITSQCWTTIINDTITYMFVLDKVENRLLYLSTKLKETEYIIK
ncbi:MAG: hypothetical protein ACRC77_10415 [Bacteroidales bacterium]